MLIKMNEMQGNLQIFEYDPVIYPRLVWIVMGEDIEDAIKGAFCERSGDALNLEGWVGARAGTWGVKKKDNGRYGVLIWIIGEPDVEVAAHEAVHAANCICGDCGIVYEPSSDEHFAFLVGHIAQWMWDAYKADLG